MDTDVGTEIVTTVVTLAAPPAFGNDGLEAALSAWTKIDLPALQRDLDNTGIQVSEIQTENQVSRKKLAELTKDFRKIPDEEKLNAFKSLLKSYQNEIDAMARRSQVAQSAFLNLYKLFSDAPDPVPIVSAFVQQSHRLQASQSLELDVKRLRTELDSALSQLSAAKKEASDAAQLREKLAKQEALMAQTVEKEVAARESALQKDYEDRIAAMKEREHYLTRQLAHSTETLATLQSTHQDAQGRLLEASQKTSEWTSARVAELELVSTELDDVRAKLERSEAERARLEDRVRDMERTGDGGGSRRKRSSGAGARGSGGGSPRKFSAPGSIPSSPLSSSYAVPSTDRDRDSDSDTDATDPHLHMLLADLDRLRATHAASEHVLRERVAELEAKNEEWEAEVARLKPLEALQAEMERVKGELAVLKTIEFGDSYDAEPDSESHPDSLSQSDTALERLLLGKNRRLAAELAELKLSLDSALGRLHDAEKERDEVAKRERKSTALVAKLEEDLMRVSGGVPVVVGGNAAATGGASRDGRPALRTHPTTEEVLTAALEGVGRSGPGSAPGSATASLESLESDPTRGMDREERGSVVGISGDSGAASLVPILTGQRDRYRQKNAELEEQTRALQAKTSELRRTIDQLKEDNVRLYEKMRFVEAYKAGGQPSTELSPWGDVDGTPNDRESGTRIDMGHPGIRRGYAAPISALTSPAQSSLSSFGAAPEPTSTSGMDQYRTEYESRLDPFRRFNLQERREQLNRLTPSDRFSLRLANAVFGNRLARTFFVSYLGALHLFVAVLMYGQMMQAECRHDHELEYVQYCKTHSSS